MPRRVGASSLDPRTVSRAARPAGKAEQVGQGAKTGSRGAAAVPGRLVPPAKTVASNRGRVADAAVRQTSAVVTADGGVVLAGHAVATADCSQCGQRGCRKCRLGAGQLDLPCNGQCAQGGCPAHCPVRPDQFGYYATRWRSWPGQSVKQGGQFDPATTPVVPPRSEVPGMAEELALPNQQDEGVPDDETDEAGDEAMPSGEEEGEVTPPKNGTGDEAGESSSSGGVTEEGSPEPTDELENPSRTSNDAESDGRASAPRPSADSGAEAVPAAGQRSGTAWANLGGGPTLPSSSPQRGSVMQMSGPVAAEESDPRGGSREIPRLRSTAERFVERNEQVAGRWRAKAAAAGTTGADTAANPLRGVTAQPGNPLR